MVPSPLRRWPCSSCAIQMQALLPLIERANQSLAEYQKIRHWHVWTEPDFPRTATHKVLKREVAER